MKEKRKKGRKEEKNEDKKERKSVLRDNNGKERSSVKFIVLLKSYYPSFGLLNLYKPLLISSFQPPPSPLLPSIEVKTIHCSLNIFSKV